MHGTPEAKTAAIRLFLERLDRDNRWGWPDIDVRARYYYSLGRPDLQDPSETFAGLWRLVEDDRLPVFRQGPSEGQPDWDDAERIVYNEWLGPIGECPECQARGDCPPGHGGEIVRNLLHRGRGKIDCQTYREAKAPSQTCRHGHQFGDFAPGDFHGCLTACCGAAWSVNDGPPYCKCCYAEIDPSYDRHQIYKLWEAPDLGHYAERIARLL